jgi:hypothetical protein
MSNVILPSIIQGPCYLAHGGVVQYVKKDIQVSDNVESWNPETATGTLGERHKSRSYKLTYTNNGMISAALLDYYFAALLDLTKIGKSIINGAATIYSLTENKTYAFNAAGLSKPPNLVLSPAGTVWEAAELTAIGDVTKQPTDAAALRTLTNTFTADTTFDESKVVTDIYKAALGARTTPYNGMGSIDGFKLNFGFSVKNITAGDVGIADVILMDVTAGAGFTPSNLTEAEIDTLLGVQGAGAILPGQSYAKANEDLVITGTQTGWVFTLKHAGAKKQDRQYLAGDHRHKEITFVNSRKYTTGAPGAYLAYTAPV